VVREIVGGTTSQRAGNSKPWCSAGSGGMHLRGHEGNTFFYELMKKGRVKGAKVAAPCGGTRQEAHDVEPGAESSGPTGANIFQMAGSTCSTIAVILVPCLNVNHTAHVITNTTIDREGLSFDFSWMCISMTVFSLGELHLSPPDIKLKIK